jgi:outer membrane protein assembly factor BamB
MAAPSRGLYIFVSICCFMVIPLGLLAPKVGPKLIDAWQFRKLGRPLEARGPVVGYLWAGGNYAGGGGGKPACRLDLEGRVVREWPGTGDGFVAELLANGNLLFSNEPQGQALEANPAGETVWTSASGLRLASLFDLQRLANGHTLCASAYNSQRAVELDEKGREVWSFTGPGNIYSVQRLANGNTLLAADSAVQEVTPAGQVAWEKRERLASVVHARRLANGNTLITSWFEGSVTEFDREGREVWSFACPYAFSAERLPDGKTLVAHRNPDELLLVSPDGTKRVLATGLAGGKARAIYAGR